MRTCYLAPTDHGLLIWSLPCTGMALPGCWWHALHILILCRAAAILGTVGHSHFFSCPFCLCHLQTSKYWTSQGVIFGLLIHLYVFVIFWAQNMINKYIANREVNFMKYLSFWFVCLTTAIMLRAKLFSENNWWLIFYYTLDDVNGRSGTTRARRSEAFRNQFFPQPIPTSSYGPA